MQQQTIILALLTMTTLSTILPYCPCSVLTSQSFCYENLSCEWSDQKQYCSDLSNPCASYVERETCDAIDGCAWTNEEACEAFTKCSDYEITYSSDAEQCYQKDDSCVPGNINFGESVTCKTGFVRCSNVQDLNICGGLVQSDGQWCAPVNHKCVAQDISRCSTITNQDLCLLLNCGWYIKQEYCEALFCSDFDTEETCYYARSESLGYAQMCAWCNNQCTEAIAIEISEDSTCFFRSEDNYNFIESISYQGPDPNCTQINFNQILTFVVSVLLIF